MILSSAFANKKVSGLDQKGLTLIEIMVAVAISGVVLTSFVSFIQGMYVSEANLRAKREFNNLVDRTFTVLKSENNCRLNFSSLPLTTGGSTDIPIFEYDKSNNKIEEVAKSGKNINNLITVKSVLLKPTQPISKNRWMASLEITADLMYPSRGSAHMFESIPIFANTDQLSSITSCFGKVPSSGEDLMQSVCATTSQGEYYFDTATRQCKSRYAKKCFPGNHTTARCGQGGIGLIDKDFYSCSSDLVDPNREVFSRTYENGINRFSAMPRPYVCNPNPNDTMEVSCAYANDLPSASATCSACCNVDLLLGYSVDDLADAQAWQDD